MTLKSVLEKLENIASYSGRKDKENLIKEYSNDFLFREVIYYALHPFKMYNTTTVPKENFDSEIDIFSVLDDLSNKRGATDDDIKILGKAASCDDETLEITRRIVNKDLRCGANIKTFKKFIPEIPEFEVMRAEKDLEKFIKNCDNDFNNIYVSIKFDGVRCVTSGNGIYLSRNGKEFPNFSVFNEELKELKDELKRLYSYIEWDDVIFDGEVISSEFQELMSQVRRLKDVDPNDFVYYIFDITLDNFTFEERYKMLSKAFSNLECKKISLVSHFIASENFNTLSDLIEYSNEVIKSGYEGLVLKNVNGVYERKKSKHWCKIKEVYTVDVKVIDWQYGKGKYKDLLGGLICEFKDGTQFHVGSGFSDEERKRYLQEIPNIIEIEYQELTKDKKPRFPIFKRVREDKNEID